jgi:hypothetical protein
MPAGGGDNYPEELIFPCFFRCYFGIQAETGSLATGPTATQSVGEVAVLGPAAFRRKRPENSPLNIGRMRAPDTETRLRLVQGAHSGRRSPLGTIACQDGSNSGVRKPRNWARLVSASSQIHLFVESRKESALRIPFERNIIRTNVLDH